MCTIQTYPQNNRPENILSAKTYTMLSCNCGTLTITWNYCDNCILFLSEAN